MGNYNNGLVMQLCRTNDRVVIVAVCVIRVFRKSMVLFFYYAIYSFKIYVNEVILYLRPVIILTDIIM